MLYFNVIVISIVSYSFVIVSFFYACSGNVKQSKLTQEEKSIVTLSPIEKKLDNHISVYSECSNYNNNLSAVASSIKFVSLATEPPLNDEFVNDIELSDDYIFIWGPDLINKYDLTGKLSKRLGAKGGGPEEYVYLDPLLQLDREHRLIYALEGA